MNYDNDGTPIYQQIAKRIKAEIITGTLAGGDRMPSVRDGAEAHRVNPNTMHRVLSELEREGVIVAQRGIGFFVNDDPSLIDRLRRTEAARVVDRFLSDMQALGFERTDLHAMLHDPHDGSRS